MPGFVKRTGKPFTAYPYNIWCDIIVSAEDQSRRLEYYANIFLLIPQRQNVTYLSARVLVLKTWLSRHVKFSIYDLVALAVVRHQRQLTGSKFFGNCGIVTHDFDLWIESSMSAETTQNTPYAVLERIVLLTLCR